MVNKRRTSTNKVTKNKASKQKPDKQAKTGLTAEQKRAVLGLVQHVLVSRGNSTVTQLAQTVEENYPDTWQMLATELSRFSPKGYVQRFVLPKLASAAWSDANWLQSKQSAPDEEPTWVVRLEDHRCRHCLNEVPDEDFKYRIDQQGGIYCGDRCYDDFVDLAGQAEWPVDDADDESHPYYYDYTELRDLYRAYLADVRSWEQLPVKTGEQMKAVIIRAEELVEDMHYSVQQFVEYWGSDDGPFGLELSLLVHALQRLLVSFLRKRIELVYQYWNTHWQQELDERASGDGAYRKSTLVMDEVERMYLFYSDEFPEEEGTGLDDRFEPIFAKMLAWRPVRKDGLFGFGLKEKHVCYDERENEQLLKALLDIVEAETGFRLKESSIHVPNENYVRTLEYDTSTFEYADYSWVFKSEAYRDEVFERLQPFFVREDLKHLWWYWDEDDGPALLELVKFTAFSCECGEADRCSSYVRSIDAEYHQGHHNGWFVCHYSSSNLMEDDYQEGYDDEFHWMGIYFINSRREFRLAGERVPRDAYAPYEREELGWE